MGSITTTPTAPPKATSRVPFKNPKDDMTSTWRAGDRRQWSYFEKAITTRGLYPWDNTKALPVHPKTDKIPAVPEWHVHRWILYHAAIPMAIHQWYLYRYPGSQVHPIIVIAGYTLALLLTGIHQFNVMRWMAHRYGFLDGEKKRDDVPDHSTQKAMLSLVFTVASRMVMAVLLTYVPSQAPIQLDWVRLPIFLGVYGVVLDFWFYWYHRLMHHYESLWSYHRTHHLTKHPTAMLTEYADEEQEVLDMVGIPLLTFLSMHFMGLHLGFYEWWICSNYLVYTELVGHSGLRIHSGTVSPVNWILRYFACELVIEDHDLHHRKGWKKSHNYGKQTRLWDRVFGTVGERIESREENVDWKSDAYWPMFY